ncbi:peptidase [Moraxella bovoculi]|uniref:L,D-transpeptidase n=1 Tax=Moraxella bovoculi TaxID=386891 RepID=UPI000624640A|nr:L,D-transpeptidase [Moraxella bovoculi]AKG18488.1 peptidase [Moraxella bovoculi]
MMANIHLLVDTSTQCMSVFDGDEVIHVFEISTAKNGTGQLENTGCTPLGHHQIAQKIGGDCPKNAVFVGRVFTGEIYDEQLGLSNPDRDWILSRILWLDGCEMGVNKGNNADGVCDSLSRYIYIHGTPDTEPMGVPRSHGCVRMRNDDIVLLYEVVNEGTPVLIV